MNCSIRHKNRTVDSRAYPHALIIHRLRGFMYMSSHFKATRDKQQYTKTYPVLFIPRPNG